MLLSWQIMENNVLPYSELWNFTTDSFLIVVKGCWQNKIFYNRSKQYVSSSSSLLLHRVNKKLYKVKYDVLSKATGRPWRDENLLVNGHPGRLYKSVKYNM